MPNSIRPYTKLVTLQVHPADYDKLSADTHTGRLCVYKQVLVLSCRRYFKLILLIHKKSTYIFDI